MGSRLNKEKFIEKSILVHKLKYDYTNVKYIKDDIKVDIICKEHGVFKQRPRNHLNGNGCPTCSKINVALSNIKTTSDFIKKADYRHDKKYNYSKTEYISAKNKVCIICPEHGEFWQKANNHVQGQGCPKCGKDSSYKNKSENIISNKFEGLIQPEDYKLIPLGGGKFAKVDNEDFDKVKNICWSKTGDGYAENKTYGRMHRFIVNCPNYKLIDHDNRDRLDNRKDNLIICTYTENSWNRDSNKNSTSKYKGVSFSKDKNCWIAQICIDSKNINIGKFDNELDAYEAYDKKASELRGRFHKTQKVNKK